MASRQGQGFMPRGYAPCIPPLKPPPFTPIQHHSPYLPDIQTSFPQTFLHGINPSLPRSIHCAPTKTLPCIDSLGNLIILHSLHMTNHLSLHKYTRVPRRQGGVEVKSMIGLVLVNRDMLLYVQDMRAVRAMGRGLSDHTMLYCVKSR